MVVNKVNISQLKEYIISAFENDTELIEFYDNKAGVTTVSGICENVFDKICSLVEPIRLRGISIEGEKAAFFVFAPGTLISFGINKKFRNDKYLIEFWGIIKSEIGNEFSCALFDYNVRAIKWLQKMGMEIIFENLTILKLCQQ